MACPLCGDVCRCAPEFRLGKNTPLFQPHMEPASEAGRSASADPPLTDFEAGQARDQHFAPDGRDEDEHGTAQSLQTPGSWREEIAARVDRYHSRRRSRSPRYPSLRLKFDMGDPANQARMRAGSASIAAMEETAADTPVSPSAAGDYSPAHRPEPEASDARLPNKSSRETTARIIAFPRASPVPVPVDELAEPVFDRPRILEVPEVAPPPPALGGILIEPVEEKEIEKRPGFDVPLRSASVEQRLLAAAVDAVIVFAASFMFAYLFVRITGLRLPLSSSLRALATATGVFWAAYEYLLLVYTGRTPGLQAARLRLSRFDGTPTCRSLRRWRVLASILSAISLGMGYLWCVLDEDALCWHDRVTHTYLEPL
jgi:uncharacterized RDD family membrane protein YckC